MKVERFVHTEEEFREFLDFKGVRILNEETKVEDGFERFGLGITDPIKFILYPEGTEDRFIREVDLPSEIFCGTCKITYQIENRDGCPVCGTTHKGIQERNSTMEETFRPFEEAYSVHLTNFVRKIHPLCLYMASLITKDVAVERLEMAYKEFEKSKKDLEKHEWLFADNILDELEKIKGDDISPFQVKRLLKDKLGG
jgi:hypothetical protein